MMLMELKQAHIMCVSLAFTSPDKGYALRGDIDFEPPSRGSMNTSHR